MGHALHFGERRGYVDLDERQLRGVVERAGDLAVGLQRRNRAKPGHHAGVGQQPGQMPNAADVLGAIACGEAEIVGQAVPDVVTVQQVGHLTGFDERPLDGHGDG